MEPTEVKRPWGSFRQFTKNEQTTVKIITVNPGDELSLQYHKNRDEFWKVISGAPVLVIDEQTIESKNDDEFFIRRGSKHRIIASKDPVQILEISFGDFDEDDIIRLEDRYGRS